MKTRRMLVAAAVLLGGVYVAAQVESPENVDPSRTGTEEVSSSTSARQQDGEAGGAFENAASTSTRDASGARPPGGEDISAPDRDTGTPAETDTDAGSSDDEAVRDSGSRTSPGTGTDSETRPQRP